MKINYTELPVKVHYFFFMAAIGAMGLYTPLYGKQLGISPLIMGSILGITPIVSLIGKLILGYAADYFLAWRKAIFTTLFAVTGICYFLIYFVPAVPGPILLDDEFQNVSCESLLPCDKNHHASAVESCNGMKDTTCHWICKDRNFSIRLSFHPTEKEAIISSDTTCLLNINETSLCRRNVTANYNCDVTCDNFEDDQCLYTSTTFWTFIILMLITEVGNYVSYSVNDTICFDILGKVGQMRYGKQRLWGSISFCLVTLLSGYTIDLWSQGKVYKTYTPAFILVLIFTCIDLICFIKFIKLPVLKSPNILKNVWAILKLVPIITFLCTTMFAGIIESPVINFLFWYIEDLAMATGYMNQVRLIQGLTITSAFLGSKVIFLFMSGKILKKFGYGYTLIFCFLSYSLRMALISLAPTPWYIIPIDVILEGPSEALLHATTVTYASAISPPGTSATIQAIAAGIKDGLGFAIGTFLSGFLFKKVGGQLTLRIYSGLAAILALVYLMIYILYLRHTTLSSDTRNNVEWRQPEDAREQCEVDEM